MTDLHWVKILADNWRGRNGNSTTGDSVRNSCADELEKVAARNGILVVAQEEMQYGCPYIDGDECLLEKHSFGPCLCVNLVAQGEPDAARMRRAILGYLDVHDACGGSESVSAERFADARHALREAVAEVPEPAQSDVGCDDYVVVPREPTPEMIGAARLAIAGDASALYRSEAASIECFYRSMIGAVAIPSTVLSPAAQCEHGNHLETCTICLMWRSLPSTVSNTPEGK